MVERARSGRFSEADGRDAPKQLLDRWFDRDGDELVAKPALARATKFEVGDLLRMPFPKDRYDLVLCRNTVIYFEEPVRDALHGRLVGAIRPGGYLLIGATERVAEPSAIGLESVRPFLYRKAV
jgi:chemotaxis protein methyltransferase CheR